MVGHYHLNVTSVEAHKKFWVDTLGGTAIKFGSAKVDVIQFPGVFLFLHQQVPTGPTRGTTLDHIGFAVPDVPKMTTKVVANGYGLTVGREPGPGETAAPPTAGNYGKFSYLVGPDGVKVELVTNDAPNAPPIMHHHVHFVNKQFVEMQQWYMKALDATLRPGQTDYFIGADLPGVGYMLNFFSWLPNEKLVGTKGRAIDHVGFEVKEPAGIPAEAASQRNQAYRALSQASGYGQYRKRVHHRSLGHFDRTYRRLAHAPLTPFESPLSFRLLSLKLPQTLRAVSATSASLRHCWSIVSKLPGAVDANPHCVLIARFSIGMYFAASSIRRRSSS